MLAAPAAAAGAWWWWALSSEPSPNPLEPGWAATVFVVAGDGVAGTNDGPVDRARFSDPFGIAVASDGTVYVADAGQAHRIRRISTDGQVSTLAGGSRGFADGHDTVARFDTPSGLAIDVHGTLYVADTGNNAIRRITRDGAVSTLAGNGTAGHRDGPRHEARFNGPIGIAVAADGRVIVADTYNDRIRAIAPDGRVTTLASSVPPHVLEGFGGDAPFDTPCGVAIDTEGTIYVADTGNDAVRAITSTGRVRTLLLPIAEGLFRPIGIAASSTGEIYVTDERGRIIELASDGTRRIVAGSTPGFRDGDGSTARFRLPAGIAAHAPGRLFVADAGNALVRLVAARSQLDLQLPASPLIAPDFDPDVPRRVPLLWPADPLEGPHEIAGTLGEARGGDAGQRFHAGVDVRADEGTPVVAVRAGIVSSPVASSEFGSLNESVRIGPLAYVHLRVGRGRRNDVIDPARFVPTYDGTGKLIRIRVKRGTRIEAGDIIGTINALNHVHLNIGWPGQELNPLGFELVQFDDTVPPTIASGGIRLYDEHGQVLSRRVQGRLLVSGRVHVVVDAWDQVDGNRPSRRLGLYEVGYQVLTRDGEPASGFEAARDTIRFDRVAEDPDAANLVYARGSGIPFYGRRPTRFLYRVTNTFRAGVASAGAWDTTALAAGDYTLRIRAADIRGNEAVANRDLPVTIVAPDR